MANFDRDQPLLRLGVKNEGKITVYHPAFAAAASDDDNFRRENAGRFLLINCVLSHHCGSKADEMIPMRVITLHCDDEVIIKIFCPNCGLRLPDRTGVKLRTVKDLFTWCEWN